MKRFVMKDKIIEAHDLLKHIEQDLAEELSQVCQKVLYNFYQAYGFYPADISIDDYIKVNEIGKKLPIQGSIKVKVGLL